MKLVTIITSLLISSGIFAQQLGFDFGHPDEILKKDFYPGEAGTTLVTKEEIPEVVREEISNVDVAFELADGYYDYLSRAYYSISHQGTVIGYMKCNLLSYTEDPELPLTAVKFNLKGKRITGYQYDDLIINYFSDEDEAKANLPKELHPREW